MCWKKVCTHSSTGCPKIFCNKVKKVIKKKRQQKVDFIHFIVTVFVPQMKIRDKNSFSLFLQGHCSKNCYFPSPVTVGLESVECCQKWLHQSCSKRPRSAIAVISSVVYNFETILCLFNFFQFHIFNI